MSGAVLIVKLGALGDFVQALGPCAAIRRHHAGARVVLLTTRPFAGLARASGLFDEVWEDRRPRLWQPGAWLSLRRRILDAGFARVYDLQTSDRSGFYFRMLWPRRPQWCGIAPGCSHRHDDPRRTTMHTVDRQRAQLALAGIDDVPLTDLSWVRADVGRFGLPDRYGLLVPGGAPHRPAKRWPAERYAAVARRWAAEGVAPVVLGTEAEAAVIDAVLAGCPEAHSLRGRTGLEDIAVLGRGAVAAVGNDTGPMHLLAMAGCPSVVLFSAESRPELCAPRGPAVAILRRDNLADLREDEVVAALDGIRPGDEDLKGEARCG